MTRYIALVDFSDDGYGVSFPDAPGCTSMAAGQEEAINDASDALAEWVTDENESGRIPPLPRSMQQLLGDAGVTAALAAGAVLVSIPLLLDSGKLARANISIDAGLLADIDDAARRGGVTRSAFLAAAARDRIKAIA